MITTSGLPAILDPLQIGELRNFSLYADREARSDLALNYIRDEDDYTSNLTGALRRIVNSNSRTGLVASTFMLGTADERRTGCDAAIVIRGRAATKVALFEAKLPRFGVPGRRWDYEQTATGGSHYSDQLERQKRFVSQFAVFEIFYCNAAFKMQPAGFGDELSTCVWHADAVAFESGRVDRTRPWTFPELTAMLTARPLVTLPDIIESVCECSAGVPLAAGLNAQVIAAEFQLNGCLILEIDASGEPPGRPAAAHRTAT